jgi:hypothetical protein
MDAHRARAYLAWTRHLRRAETEMFSMCGGGVLSLGENERERMMRPGKATRKKLVSKVKTAGYSRRPLAAKLGIKAGVAMAIIGAPDGFENLIGTTKFDTELDLESYDYLHFFTESKVALETIYPILAKRLNRGGILWISWPKKASGKQMDLSEHDVRGLGLATGLVDGKVCAIDEVWSGLKFMHRRTRPSGPVRIETDLESL